jgi:predicted DCC family thiol-disulfide oxidoreductase YuxK
MDVIHARLPSGEWVTGLEVFRLLYTSIGFGPLVWISRWPLISQLLNAGYGLFARNRLRLTGRCAADACRSAVPERQPADVAGS